jgi:enamine deaminase RidA (YjgF/YER057c/UK114 family)
VSIVAMAASSLKRIGAGPRLAEAVIHSGIAYLAGQVPDGAPEADITAQTREVLAHVERVLKEAGSDKSRILQCQIFLRDIADIAAMDAVWDQWVPAGHAPPRATVQAALADPRWRIEVVLVAALVP